MLVELLVWRDYIYTIKRLIVCMSKSGSESHFKLVEIRTWLLVVGQIQYDVLLVPSFDQYEIDWEKKTMLARINQMESTWKSGGAFPFSVIEFLAGSGVFCTFQFPGAQY